MDIESDENSPSVTQKIEADQQRVYRTMQAIAASGCPVKGDWLALFNTRDNPALEKNLSELLVRLRQTQSADLVSPAPHDRLEDARGIIEADGLQGMILGHDDENLCEYVTIGGERLRWLTGFRGSAGFLLILPKSAYLFVDGRYTLQAPNEVDPHFISVKPLTPDAIAEQIAADMPASEEWHIGIDPNLFSMASHRQLSTQLSAIGARLSAVSRNPVDYFWRNRPPNPFSPIRRVSDEIAGQSTQQKIDQLCAQLRQKNCDCTVVQAPEDILWLLNVRAWDLDTAPLCLSKMIIHAEGSVDWFLSPEKKDFACKLADWQNVYLHEEENFSDALTMLAQAGSRVWVDVQRVAARIVMQLQKDGAVLFEAADPIQLMAATLNATECAGARDAHLADGEAMISFMADVAENPEPCQESDLVQRLLEHRQKQPTFEQESFHAIVAVRGNSAQCHYRPIEGADQRVRWGDTVLIDSGGHYRHGTTDITRVIAYDQGDVPVSAEFREHYTLVLQGLIAISQTRFPKGTTGQQLDTLARIPLWQQGLDYEHGTGHGVGSNSLVHFGPHRIAKQGSGQPLREGMMLSLEPGVYFPHRYGIRLENLAIVCADPARTGGLCFETVTFVPFVRRMIVSEMLSSTERAWLNNYHAEVYRRLAGRLSRATAQWLANETRVI